MFILYKEEALFEDMFHFLVIISLLVPVDTEKVYRASLCLQSVRGKPCLNEACANPLYYGSTYNNNTSCDSQQIVEMFSVERINALSVDVEETKGKDKLNGRDSASLFQTEVRLEMS